MESQLTSSHRATYNAVFAHPLAHNLKWQDVWGMLGAMGEAVQQDNGNLKVTRNGQTIVLHRPRHKDLADARELTQIRHFLERSEAPPTSTAAGGTHLLVVIDHRLARIYKAELHGTAPQSLVPYDRGGAGRHLHQVEGDASGQRKPENKAFYASILQSIKVADQILIFGSGTGASSAMEHLIEELNQHFPEVRKRVVGSIVVDETHLSEDQLLARARDFYADLAAKKSSTPMTGARTE
jgi:hypothetical protein